MSKRRRQGFTLVELLVAIAIVGVLAATSASLWQDAVRDARESELVGTVQALVSAQMLRASAYDTFTDCPEQPRSFSAVDREQVSWPESFTGYQLPGWTPPEAPRGSYYCTVGARSDVALVCGGLVDGDGDGTGTAYAMAVQQVALARAERRPTLLGWLFPDALAADVGSSLSFAIQDFSVQGASSGGLTGEVLSRISVMGGAGTASGNGGSSSGSGGGSSGSSGSSDSATSDDRGDDDGCGGSHGLALGHCKDKAQGKAVGHDK